MGTKQSECGMKTTVTGCAYQRVLRLRVLSQVEQLAYLVEQLRESTTHTQSTTGEPKGVMLTHQNFVSNLQGVSTVIEFSEKDTVLSFLPLAHVLERMVMFTYLYKGCSISFAESIDTVGENLLEVKPHIMVSVPRVFEKIYAKVIDNVLTSSSLKRKIFLLMRHV